MSFTQSVKKKKSLIYSSNESVLHRGLCSTDFDQYFMHNGITVLNHWITLEDRKLDKTLSNGKFDIDFQLMFQELLESSEFTWS